MLERDPRLACSGITRAVRRVDGVALWSMLAVVALDNLGVELTALVAALGIAGVALALAARTVLGDLLAWLAIVLDCPFDVDHVVSIGDVSGT